MLRSKSKENAPGVIDSRSNMLHSPASEREHVCSGTAVLGHRLPSHGPRQASKSVSPDPCCALWKTFLLMFCSESPRDPCCSIN